MFELEKLGIKWGRKSVTDLFKAREKFELIDGIKFGQTRMVFATDDEDLFTISIAAKNDAVKAWGEGKIFRMLATYDEDGGIKEILIDFSEPYLPWQADQNPDLWQREP